MNFSQILYLYADNFFIWFFRITDIPILGYLSGTFFLALVCVIMGQITFTFACQVNQKWLVKDNQKMVQMHNLSLMALAAKDKNAYTACNKQANDAFGKYFFSQLALGISSLWPVPFALGWMQTRFANINFLLPFNIPYAGNAVGYTCTFILIYILAYIFFGNVKNRLPYFKSVINLLQVQQKDAQKMISFNELFETDQTNKTHEA